MIMQNFRLAALALFTLLALSLPGRAGTLDDYYLQQFGETPAPARKAVSESATELPDVSCGMPLKHDLRRDWNQLEPATQTVLAKQLAAPVLSGEATLSSAHFVIHYTTSGTDTPLPTAPYTLPSWVQQVANSFETAYTTYQAMGYRPPPVLPCHIYLRSLASLKRYGQTTAVSAVPSAGFPNAYSSYIEIDKDFTNDIYTRRDPVSGVLLYTPLDSLSITSAHEFHHAIQFGYNVFFDVWYAEATSTWYEGELYPDVLQYYGYVHPWFVNSKKRLDLAVDANAVSTGAGYARWIFNRYLTEQHSTGLVRTIWENLAPLNSTDGISSIPMLPVINTALAGGLPADFLGFARRVYLQREWPQTFDKTTTRLQYIPIATYSVNPVNSLLTPKPEAFLEQYSFAYYRFLPASFPGSLVTISLNATPAIAARAFKKDNGGTISETITEYSFPNAYPSFVSIQIDAATTEVVLLLVNTSGSTTQNANFSTDGISSLLPTAPVTTTPPPAAAVTPVVLSSGGGGGGCFIATAAYGSYLHPQVQLLRDFRDTRLLTNAPGRAFVALYYRFSPPLAGYIAQHAGLRLLVRLLLAPLILAVAHPGAAGALLLAVACVMSGRVRSRRDVADIRPGQAV